MQISLLSEVSCYKWPFPQTRSVITNNLWPPLPPLLNLLQKTRNHDIKIKVSAIRPGSVGAFLLGYLPSHRKFEVKQAGAALGKAQPSRLIQCWLPFVSWDFLPTFDRNSNTKSKSFNSKELHNMLIYIN